MACHSQYDIAPFQTDLRRVIADLNGHCIGRGRAFKNEHIVFNFTIERYAGRSEPARRAESEASVGISHKRTGRNGKGQAVATGVQTDAYENLFARVIPIVVVVEVDPAI